MKNMKRNKDDVRRGWIEDHLCKVHRSHGLVKVVKGMKDSVEVGLSAGHGQDLC